MTTQHWSKVLYRTEWQERFPTRESFLNWIQEEKENERVTLTAADLYRGISEAFPEAELEPFTELPQKEREQRAKLSARARMTILQNNANAIYSDWPATNYRYVRELMMKPHRFPAAGQSETKEMRLYNHAVDAQNAHLLDVFSHMADHRTEALDNYVSLLRDFEKSDPLALVDHALSDEEVIDNYERIRVASSICTQFYNFRNDMKNQGITPEALTAQLQALQAKEAPTDAEKAEIQTLSADIEKIRYLEQMEEKYSLFGEAFFQLDARIGLIDSPYYERMDLNQPNIRKAFDYWLQHEGDVDSLEIPGDTVQSPELQKGLSVSNHSDIVSNIMKERNEHFWMGEYQAAKQQLLKNGAAPENLVFKVDGEDEVRPCAQENKFTTVVSDGIIDKPITVFDATNPDNAVTICGTNPVSQLQEFAQQRRLQQWVESGTLPPYPVPPTPVKKPVLPSVDIGKQFWYAVTFHNAYTAELEQFNAVAKPEYEKEMERYQEYLKKMERYNAEKNAITDYRQKFMAAVSDDVRERYAAEVAIIPADLVPEEALSPEAVEAKSRKVPPIEVNRQKFDNVFDTEFAAPAEPLATELPEEVASERIKEIATSLSTCCELLLGTDEQDRLFYLDGDNHLRSYKDIDLFDPKEQVKFLQMFHSNRLFAIPAGETTPVQLQVADRTTSHGVVYADNLGCPPKAPNVNRFWARLTGNGREQLALYKKALAQSARATSVRSEIDRITIEREAAGFDRRALTNTPPQKGSPAADEKNIARELMLGEQRTNTMINRFRDVEKAVVQARKAENANADLGKEQWAFRAIRDLYGAKPVFHSYMVDATCYTKKSFEMLKPLDVKLLPGDSAPKMGENGLLQLSEDDFASLAASAMMLPEIAKNIVEESLQSGASEEAKQAFESLRADTCYDMNSAMLRNDMLKDFSRNEGWTARPTIDNFFANTIEPAREKTAEAVHAYEKGDRQPLSKIIAYNMMEFRRSGLRATFSSVSNRTVDKIYARQVAMLEKDPALKTAVQAQMDAFKTQSRKDLNTYTAEREALLRQNPDFERLRDLHISSATSKKAAAEFRKELKDHPDYPGLLLKDTILAINTAYAKQGLLYNLNEISAQVTAREKVNALYADAQLEREKMAVAQAENKPLTPEQKEACLKAVMKEELLLRHDTAFQDMSYRNSEKNEVATDRSIIASANFGAFVTHPLFPLLQNVYTSGVHASLISGGAFSPLYAGLGKSDNPSAMMDESVNRLVSPAKQQELCTGDNEALVSAVKKPYALFDGNAIDEINHTHTEAYSKELADQDAQRELLTFTDEPMPDDAPALNAPM